MIETQCQTETHKSAAADLPVVICVAPNGARRTKDDHPCLPMTAAELGQEAARCAESGASVIHLHVRDSHGAHTLDVELYRSAIARIQAEVADRMLIQVTTEAVGRYTPEEQMAVVRALRPPAASVALRELVPDESCLKKAAEFFDWASRNRVALQFIVYTPQEATDLMVLARKGVLACQSPNTLFVLGRYTAGQTSCPIDLLSFLAREPRLQPWSVCAFGSAEAQCMAAAIGLGGHVRVGFENNLLSVAGTRAECNAQQVANVADLARHSGRGVASLALAREIYGAQ